MRRQRGFTLIELLVVIAIIALLMAILMPALQRVRKQAKTVACLSLLKQWSLWFSMYTEDYGGYFMEGFDGTSKGTGSNRWCRAMGEYHKYDSDTTCCPNATQPWFDEFGNATGLEADGSNRSRAVTGSTAGAIIPSRVPAASPSCGTTGERLM